MGNKNIEEKEKEKQKEEETNDIREPLPINEFKIIFLGEPGVGAKTTLINRIMKFEFKEKINSTTACSYTQKHVDIGNNKELILQLWDTIGQEKFRFLVKVYLFNIDCVVLGYDITSSQSFKEVNYWYQTIKEQKLCNLIYLVGNKIDLDDRRKVREEEAIKYAESRNLRFFEVSCKTDAGLNAFYDDLVNHILELYKARTKKKLKFFK